MFNKPDAVENLQMTEEVRGWFKELESAKKREKDWRKDAKRIVELYESQKRDDYQFNILYSNTETMLPALYNNTPRPVVERRFKDADPLGKLASQVTQRSLEFLLDSNDQDSSNFDDMMKSAVLEALLPGRGITRFKYDATFEPLEADASEAPEAPETPPGERVASEMVCGEEVPWDRFLHGYAKKWKDVPWVAFEHFMDKEELEKTFGEQVGGAIPLTITGGDDEEESEDDNSDRKDAEGCEFAHVFEIWDKQERTVLFIARGYGEVAKKVDDPLGLSGFFPNPRPLSFYAKVSGLLPTPLYLSYEEQAKELNYVTLRINKVMRALKVRGFYDSTLSGLDELMKQDDNSLLPAENVAAMLQGQTLERAIWFFPIEKLVGVLQQLYMQRDLIKQTIYEITGISDILRGASVASETATAQNIKNQWGTLRLKRAQKEVSRYVRDCLRIMAEIAVKKLGPDILGQMTGMQLPTAEQKAQAQGLLQQVQAQGAQPPEELTAILSQPTWEDVLGLLGNNLQRAYRIDIETNSTVDIDATEDKQNVAEFTGAFAQLLNGLAPMVEKGTLPFPAAKAIMLNVCRKYRFGTEIEDELAKMAEPQPQTDPKAEADKAKMQLEMQRDQAKFQQESATRQQEAMLAQKELQMREQELNMKQRELAMKAEFLEAQHQMKMQQLVFQANQPKAPGAPEHPQGDL